MGMGGPGGGMHVFMWGPSGRQEGKRPSLSMYRRLLRYVAPYKWNLVFAAVLLIISTALGLVWPRVVQAVIDLGLGGRCAAALLDRVHGEAPLNGIGGVATNTRFTCRLATSAS